MFTRRVAAAIVSLVLAGTLTGCVADYVDGSICETVDEDVSAVLADELGTSNLDSTGLFPAGVAAAESDAAIWCVLTFDTGLDLAHDAPGRQNVKAKISDIVTKLRGGAYVTITYASIDGEQYEPDRQDFFISPGTVDKS